MTERRDAAIREAVRLFQERHDPRYPLAVKCLRDAERTWNETVAEPIPDEIASVLRRLK
jgi:hypothetical protein